ncbi:MAG: peptide deformylase [Planctomycetes bacterium]|nr:peptide deformylase [Planctomycetota bacterium]
MAHGRQRFADAQVVLQAFGVLGDQLFGFNQQLVRVLGHGNGLEPAHAPALGIAFGVVLANERQTEIPAGVGVTGVGFHGRLIHLDCIVVVALLERFVGFREEFAYVRHRASFGGCAFGPYRKPTLCRLSVRPLNSFPDYSLCPSAFSVARVGQRLCAVSEPLHLGIRGSPPRKVSSVFKIRKYPDPILTTPAEPVTEFGPRLEQIVEEMFLTMYQERGVGLAAPQVGIGKRIFVANCEEDQPPEGEIALINPEIVSTEGEQYSDEGCLSFPGMFAKKKRPLKVTMRAQDVRGEWFEVTGEKLLARALLHERDHLDGIVFVQDLEPVEFVRLRKDLETMKRNYKRAHARA